jgi:hypothetical protein
VGGVALLRSRAFGLERDVARKRDHFLAALPIIGGIFGLKDRDAALRVECTAPNRLPLGQKTISEKLFKIDERLNRIAWKIVVPCTSARLAIGAWSVRRSVTLKDSAD